MKKTSKNTLSTFSQKIRNAVTDLSVDIFGYEKMVTKNIIQNTAFISSKTKIPKARLFLKIVQKDHTIKAYLFDQSKAIQAIPTKELAYFFIDRETAELSRIQNKIAFSIKKYLNDFALKNGLNVENLAVWIHVKDEKVIIDAFDKDQFVKEISMSSLIKFFR
ncbi:hypothetical protein U8527_06665 [Kordia algicida OT-1]|uniref:Uncharacterized protein n=1 Tax=Kordia algicida OT-1 TaxID=391587 RepID=A9CU51_9FLAO|nr:hypothetical protein [Kordia algicida]EDP94129.1 hypothetical protein KAOT1_00075 [Kordia algicida OT-1]